MNWKRFTKIKRYFHPSAWRLLALIATDPQLDALFEDWKIARPEDKLRRPLPWLTTGARDFLEESVDPHARILEWGSGSSTLWFAQRGCSVVSVEHDFRWHRLVESRVPATVTVLLRDLDVGYWNPVDSLSVFDWVIIDGRDRNRCAQFVISQIESGAIEKRLFVVFDDSHRKAYLDVLTRLSELSTRQYCFTGPVTVELDKATTVFEMQR